MNHVDVLSQSFTMPIFKDVTLKGAWEAPAGLELHQHALAPVADLPVREVVSAVHLMTDLALDLREVVHDHLQTKG